MTTMMSADGLAGYLDGLMDAHSGDTEYDRGFRDALEKVRGYLLRLPVSPPDCPVVPAAPSPKYDGGWPWPATRECHWWQFQPTVDAQAMPTCSPEGRASAGALIKEFLANTMKGETLQ